jgi:hypothetical protein
VVFRPGTRGFLLSNPSTTTTTEVWCWLPKRPNGRRSKFHGAPIKMLLAGFASPWNLPPRFKPIPTCLLRSILLWPIPGATDGIFLEPGYTCQCAKGRVFALHAHQIWTRAVGILVERRNSNRRDLVGFRNQPASRPSTLISAPCFEGPGCSLAIGKWRARRAIPRFSRPPQTAAFGSMSLLPTTGCGPRLGTELRAPQGAGELEMDGAA